MCSGTLGMSSAGQEPLWTVSQAWFGVYSIPPLGHKCPKGLTPFGPLSQARRRLTFSPYAGPCLDCEIVKIHL